MRYALALCVVAGCALCGSALAASARRRAEILSSLISALRVLSVRMLHMLEPVSEALAASEVSMLQRVGRTMQPGVSAGEAWRAVRVREGRRGGAMDALTPEDVHILDALFARLGETGREQQNLWLNDAIAALSVNLTRAEHKARESERLYLSLGLMVGLMLALVVI